MESQDESKLRADGLAKLNRYRSKQKKKAVTTQSPAVERGTKKGASSPAPQSHNLTAKDSATTHSPAMPKHSATALTHTPATLHSTVATSPALPPSVTREPLQLQLTTSETTQKLKMLEKTNKLIASENQTLTHQLRGYEERIRQLEAEHQQTEASKLEALDTIRELKDKQKAESMEYKEKDKEITSLKASLASLQSKFEDEVRLRQANQTSHEEEGQLRLLELEKKQAERDKMGVEFQLKDAAQTNVQLQTTIGEMKSRVSELEGQLTSTTSKLTHILNTQGPTERELRVKELEIERLNINHASDMQRLNAYCKQLELENASLSSQCNDLASKVQHSEEILARGVESVQNEYKDMAANYEQQGRIIEKLMAQKRCIMQQLTREVERNGALVKENLEAKQTITLQQQLLLQHTSHDVDKSLLRDISLTLTGAPRVSVPSSTANTPIKAKSNGFKTVEHYDSTQKRESDPHSNSGLVKYGNGSRLQLPPMEMNQSVFAQPITPPKGWLASIPLLGRFLTPKVPVQQVL